MAFVELEIEESGKGKIFIPGEAYPDKISEIKSGCLKCGLNCRKDGGVVPLLQGSYCYGMEDGGVADVRLETTDEKTVRKFMEEARCRIYKASLPPRAIFA